MDTEHIAAYLRELVDAPVIVTFDDTVGIGDLRDDGLVPVVVQRYAPGEWSILDPDVQGETVAMVSGQGAQLIADTAEAAASHYRTKMSGGPSARS